MAELKNRDPKLIEDAIDLVSVLLSQYGWYVLVAIIGLVFIWNKYLSKVVQQMSQPNEDPQIEAIRVEQMERARRRQQLIYDKQMEEFKQKEDQKLIQKRQQILELEKSFDKNSRDLRKRDSKTLRDNSFNPLMGSTSGSNFRPSRSCGPSSGG